MIFFLFWPIKSQTKNDLKPSGCFSTSSIITENHINTHVRHTLFAIKNIIIRFRLNTLKSEYNRIIEYSVNNFICSFIAVKYVYTVLATSNSIMSQRDRRHNNIRIMIFRSKNSRHPIHYPLFCL